MRMKKKETNSSIKQKTKKTIHNSFNVIIFVARKGKRFVYFLCQFMPHDGWSQHKKNNSAHGSSSIHGEVEIFEHVFLCDLCRILIDLSFVRHIYVCTVHTIIHTSCCCCCWVLVFIYLSGGLHDYFNFQKKRFFKRRIFWNHFWNTPSDRSITTEVMWKF